MKKRDDRPADASGLRRKAEKIARKKAALSSENLETLSPEETGRMLYELRVHQVELEMQNEELRRTQVELQASRERYFDLYDLAPVGYLTLSEKGLILEANLTVARLLGVAKGLLANQPLTRFILREDQDIWYRFHKQPFETETVQACELRIRGVKDHPFWVQIQITEDWDAEGAPLLRVTLSDISAGKKLEEKQQVREERYRSFIEVTGQLAWTTNKDGEVVEDIPVWRKFTGQTEEETKGGGWAKAIHPDDLQKTLEVWNKAVATKIPYEVEYRVRRRDGVYRHFLARGVPVFKEDGNFLEWVGTCIDITERKQIEDLQKFLPQCGLPSSGEDFFQSLARYLAEKLRMDYVCIDRLQGDALAARTEAVYFDGQFEDNLTYTLKDTPCAAVVEKTICSFPKGVRQLYPQDAVLQEMGAESYVGTILNNSKGQPIGLIAVIGRRPLENPSLAESMLALVSICAAGELERREAEEALRQRSLELQQLNDTLEQRVLERTAELEKANESLRYLSSRLLSAEEDEKKRIAREVHDVLGSSLSAIKFKMEDILHRIPKMPTEKVVENIETLFPVIKGTIDDVRRIQANLRPPLLDDLGVLATFSWFCREFQAIYSSIRVEQTINLQENEIPDSLKTVIFRITQEAMNNIAKHAGADRVYLGLRKINGALELCIQDNGKGFNLKSLSTREILNKGLGISSMKERTEFSGGTFSIESAKRKGTVIRALWPV